MNLYTFMLIYMRFHVFLRGFYVFMTLVWPTSVPQALFSVTEKRPWIFGRCQFWKLSELSEFQYVWILGPV